MSATVEDIDKKHNGAVDSEQSSLYDEDEAQMVIAQASRGSKLCGDGDC